MRQLVALAGLAVALPACRRVVSSSVPQLAVGTAPVVATDLAPSSGFTLKTHDKTATLAYLAGLRGLYNYPPSATSTAATAPSPCATLFDAAPMQATQQELLIDTTVDASACVDQTLESGLSMTGATARLYVLVTCSDGDFSSLNGRAYKDMAAIDPNGVCRTGASLAQSVVTVQGSATVEGVAFPFQISSISHDGSASAGPCAFSTADQSQRKDDACIFVEKRDSSIGSDLGQKKANEDFTKLTFSGVTDDVSSTTNLWHSAGTIGVAYDNWTGTLTYSASAVAPTYSLTPTGGSEVTGSLAQPLPASSTTSLTRALGVIGFGT